MYILVRTTEALQIQFIWFPAICWVLLRQTAGSRSCMQQRACTKFMSCCCCGCCCHYLWQALSSQSLQCWLPDVADAFACFWVFFPYRIKCTTPFPLPSGCLPVDLPCSHRKCTARHRPHLFKGRGSAACHGPSRTHVCTVPGGAHVGHHVCQMCLRGSFHASMHFHTSDSVHSMPMLSALQLCWAP